MIAEDGTAKVTDFGLAKARAVAGEASSSDAQQSILVSSGGMTPAYCSPEQANKQSLSSKTDIWSWGLSVLEMFAGEIFWRAGQAAPEALDSFMEMDVEDGSIPKMPDGLVDLLKQCFQRKPDDRPKDMEEIVKTIKGIHQQVAAKEYSRPEPKPAELLADGLNNKAVSMLDLGKKEEAEKLYEEALKADPHHPEVTYNRGLMLWRSGQITDDELVRQLEEVRTTHTNDWVDEYLLGLVHMERGDYKSAHNFFSDVRTRHSDIKELQPFVQIVTHKSKIDEFNTFPDSAPSLRCFCISQDNRWVVTGGGDRMVRLWDLATTRCVRVFEGHEADVNCVCITGNSGWILSGSGSYGKNDNTLRLWDLHTGECIRVFTGHTGKVTSVAIDYNGQFALSTDDNNTLMMWDMSTGKCLRKLGEGKFFVCISADGRWGLSNGQDNTILLWDLLVGECAKVLRGHKGGSYCGCMTSDGRQAVTSSSDKTIRLWDLLKGECIRTFIGHTSRVFCVSMDANCSRMISGSDREEETIRFWDIDTGKCVRTFRKKDGIGKAGKGLVCISGDGKWGMWENDKERRLSIHKLDEGITGNLAITFPRKSTQMAQYYQNVKNAINMANIAKRNGCYSKAWASLVQARQLPGYERHTDLIELSQRIGKHGLRSVFREAWCALKLNAHENNVTASCISGDGKWALSGGLDRRIHLWDLSTGNRIRIFEGHTGPIRDLKFDQNNEYCISAGGYDNTIRIWNLSNGNCLHVLKRHKSAVKSVSISNTNLMISTGGSIRTRQPIAEAYIWDIRKGNCLWSFENKDRVMNLSGINPDGRLILLNGPRYSVCLWDPIKDSCLMTYEGHTSWVTSCCFSSDGCYLLSGSSDKTIRLWDIASGKSVRILEGHDGLISAVALSTDGRWAFSASVDRTFRLWELGAGKCLRIFKGHTHHVNSLSIDTESFRVLTGSADGTIRLWELVWDYEFPEQSDCDEGARPYLEIFLTLHCPYGPDGISRQGKPVWKDEDFKNLLKELQYRGYGWLRPEGVRKKLEEMTINWQGPPPLPGQ